MNEPALTTALAFVDAARRGDTDVMGALMAPDFMGHVTAADGSTRLASRDQYLASIEAMDVRSASLRIDVSDSVIVEPGLVMLMLEINAERGGRRLHNHSGQLARVVDERIAELWMVDALPHESDEFWSPSRR